MATIAHAPDVTAAAQADADVVSLVVSGDLDLASAPRLCREVQRAAATAGKPRIVIDLRGVGFTDSSGLRALIGAAHEVRALAGALAVVASPGSQVDRLFTLAGAREFVAVAATVEDAIAVVGGDAEAGEPAHRLGVSLRAGPDDRRGVRVAPAYGNRRVAARRRVGTPPAA